MSEHVWGTGLTFEHGPCYNMPCLTDVDKAHFLLVFYKNHVVAVFDMSPPLQICTTVWLTAPYPRQSRTDFTHCPMILCVGFSNKVVLTVDLQETSAGRFDAAKPIAALLFWWWNGVSSEAGLPPLSVSTAFALEPHTVSESMQKVFLLPVHRKCKPLKHETLMFKCVLYKKTYSWWK